MSNLAYQLEDHPKYYAYDDVQGNLHLISLHNNKVTEIKPNKKSFRLAVEGNRIVVSFKNIRAMMDNSRFTIDINKLLNQDDVNRKLEKIEDKENDENFSNTSETIIAYAIKGFLDYYAVNTDKNIRVFSVKRGKPYEMKNNNKYFSLTKNISKQKYYVTDDIIMSLLDMDNSIRIYKDLPFENNPTVEDKLLDQKIIIKQKSLKKEFFSNDLNTKNADSHLKMSLTDCLIKNNVKLFTINDMIILSKKISEMTNENTHWRLPEKFSDYVYDSLHKNIFMILSNGVLSTTERKRKSNTSWTLDSGYDKYLHISELSILLMMYNGYCTPFTVNKQKSNKSTYMVIDTDMGFSMNKEPLTSELEASKFCREVLNRDNSKELLIVKVIGVAKFNDGYECKRLDR